jgi:hypothetical protein
MNLIFETMQAVKFDMLIKKSNRLSRLMKKLRHDGKRTATLLKNLGLIK